jgi:hypothetical protein
MRISLYLGSRSGWYPHTQGIRILLCKSGRLAAFSVPHFLSAWIPGQDDWWTFQSVYVRALLRFLP